ncbi:MAG: single-stranded-DNA-specific exonuclease RecJ [Candidatus Taylorbacteria bacterium RIFCSPLOWO2_01_FULL_44_26]|uniref:Single-stranded-DNA-specific exonuclease RecJ n=1 Tax=Candidatus Taylorbacteria bacterium RIFCSPLOWO2_01_FULL_44_26 TaxID=1802318 RepID=A0A1G2N4M2_9BACT|nr:MAG: single-stranded-DNA-specific exonuclease RecJ [Candidatus Taylorbacteria bacterium RIFCSPLOWO2_01_FULL_44_26]
MNYDIKRSLTVTERNQFGGISDLMAHLLFHRGIVDSISAEKFLKPDYERDIHDPFLLKDAGKAADRIIQAIKDRQKIAIYADYDADGIPGAAMFNDFFKRIGFDNFIIYIPHRHDEGFGLNEVAVGELAEQGVKLIITVDCGISDIQQVDIANGKGMNVIITDHHEPPAQLPAAFAIINHKQTDCAYPDKNLCGSGVAFKLIQAILAKDRLGLKEGHEKWFLDLLGIATLSDMVQLSGENRAFAHYGLSVLRKSPRKGIRRIFSKLKIDQRHLTEDDIGFMLTPRINAASRMGVPMDAFNLLTADNDKDAIFYADHLDGINAERKTAVAVLVKEVKKTLRERDSVNTARVIVLGNPAWRPSLLGLAANSCAQEFDRPVFLWGRDGENVIKGSCRSEGRTSVVELMRAVSTGVLTQFGGHRYSGGFTVHNDMVHFLDQRLNEAFSGLVLSVSMQQKSEFQNESCIDAELAMNDIDQVLYADIARLGPFGTGNPKPTFLFHNVSPLSVRKFGKGGDHIELVFGRGSGGRISAIAFFGATEDWAKKLNPNMPIDLVASLEKSMYRNRAELRLRVIEVGFV